MTVNVSPRLGLPLMATAMAQKEQVFNEAILAFDAMFSGSAISATTTTPPSSPSDGDCYIVPATGATGAWAGKAKKIAFAYNGWQFIDPPEHFRMYVVGASNFYMFTTSGGWAAVPAGSPVVFTDLTDINVSGVEDGQVLKFDEATGKWVPLTLPTYPATLAAQGDVALGTPTEGQVLAYNATTHKWHPITLPSAESFATLADVDQTGVTDGYIAAWRASDSKVHWINPGSIVSVPNLADIGNVDLSGPVSAGMALIFNGAVWTASADAISFSFEQMADGPGSLEGGSLKILRVKEDETGLEYVAPVDLGITTTLHDLTDVNVTEGSSINGYALIWNNGASKWEAKPVFSGSYTDLADKPSIPHALDDLTDVESSAPTDGQALVWDAATSKWKPGTVAGGGGGSLPTGGTAGQVLTKNSSTDGDAGWAAPTGGVGGASQPHRYWRLSNMRSPGGSVSANEIAFHSTPNGLELAATWTASTVFGAGHEASHLGDGDLATYWASASGTSSDGSTAVTADFGKPVLPVEIVITPRTTPFTNQSPSSFDVDYSDDGVTWTHLASFTAGAWTYPTPQTFTLPVGNKLATGDLRDVAPDTPLNGQALVWDSVRGLYVPGAVSAGGGSGGVAGLLQDRIAPPNAALFTTIIGSNGHDPVISNSSDGVTVFNFGISPGSGDNNRIVLKSLTASSWEIVARMKVNLLDYDYNGGGIYLRNSSNGKITCWGANGGGSNGLVQFNEWTNASTYFGTPFAMTPLRNSRWEWFKIASDGTTMGAFVSEDGDTWLKCGERAVSAFMGVIDQVGFGMQISHVANRPTKTQDNITQQWPWGPEGFIHVLYYSDPDITPNASYPGVDKLGQLNDVDLSTPPVDGQALVYDGAASKWVPGVVSGGSSTSRNNSIHVPALSQFATQWTRQQSGGLGSFTFLDDAGDGIACVGPSTNANTMAVRMRPFPVNVATNEFRIAARVKHVSGAFSTDSFSGLAIGSDDANMLMFGTLKPWSSDDFGRYYVAHFNGGTYHDDDYSLRILLNAEWVSIHFDGAGNVNFDVSIDGRNWMTAYARTIATYWASTPTHYGFGWKPYSPNSLFLMPFFYSTELPSPF